MTGAVDAPGRGRPREFDESAVLDRVVELFWEQGFEATSVGDIVEATGLNKSSLYNAFGSKDELFDQALERYVAFRIGTLTDVLVNGHDGLADIHRLLDFMEGEVLSDVGHRGCLAVNTSTELGARMSAVVERKLAYRARVRSALVTALERAERAGEIAPGSAETYAQVLVAIMFGVAVVARSGAEAAELVAQVQSIRTVVDSWRIT